MDDEKPVWMIRAFNWNYKALSLDASVTQLNRDQKALLIIIKQIFASRKMSKALDWKFLEQINESHSKKLSFFRKIFTVSQNIYKLEYRIDEDCKLQIFHFPF